MKYLSILKTVLGGNDFLKSSVVLKIHLACISVFSKVYVMNYIFLKMFNKEKLPNNKLLVAFLLLTCELSLLTAVNSFSEPKNGWSVTESSFGRAKPGQLIFSEEFNSFNFDLWKHDITMSGGGNSEFQLYDNNRTNSYVKYGKLYIKPTLTVDRYGEHFMKHGSLHLSGPAPADRCTDSTWDGCYKKGTPGHILNPVCSARIRSVNAFSFKYGRVEIRAKIPTGDWLWPSVWLLPEKNQYGSWPASGEIDILESRGNAQLFDVAKNHIGVEQVAQSLHFGPNHLMNGWHKTHFEVNSPQDRGFDLDFHMYQVEWTPDYIKFSIDNDDIAKVEPSKDGFWALGGFYEMGKGNVKNPWEFSENSKMAPFDQRFYFSIGLAVGGTNGHFPDSATGPRSKPWKNSSPHAQSDFWKGQHTWYPSWRNEDAALVIDYIRVWAI